MKLPQIKAAIAALSKVDNLPIPIIHSRPDNDGSTMPMERVKNVNDILDWIASIFGFQKGNVANQREHLILLLANTDVRNRPASDEIREETVEKLMATTFKNYESWCHYVRCKSNIRYFHALL
ncbi:putative 1,3-beta-glucan synthase [Medicago truncatula]|uniref:Putative 1,3-beta-glucan synthase n=1 Tax=Medicago truncatula TaxID=3880 RepID=A0A396JX45_MEDTR|nr:putative 1,3-beta-glucan synthase [Medicago truncatula]